MHVPCVEIVEILGRSDQGKTLPFICRATDDHIYYVKGRWAGRRSQIAELICGQLAKAFDLPVADFAVVDVPADLIQPFLRKDAAQLGAGTAFDSKALPHVQEMTPTQLKVAISDKHISARLARDVFMFDWWISNADRFLTCLGGNPNLLWDCEARQLAVIDHNAAFDADFSGSTALEIHVFADAGRAAFGDLVERAFYLERFQAALAAFDEACDNVPADWWWVDEGVPADFDRTTARAMLSLIHDDSFWEEN